ncbi:hypothetical protein M422DRAFT_272461 [Sphaerobolus stellatus SS14]|uniref:Uncharacterized protein n=1 Tax=Sphaerobolus stellatus (strain SS14) TaxID=990650 RepID=A0A0C9UMJ8_SPHS4|nr:hypothetical protein M422DRAFT_272461 [Sphaerobolus stellatus SS14]
MAAPHPQHSLLTICCKADNPFDPRHVSPHHPRIMPPAKNGMYWCRTCCIFFDNIRQANDHAFPSNQMKILRCPWAIEQLEHEKFASENLLKRHLTTGHCAQEYRRKYGDKYGIPPRLNISLHTEGHVILPIIPEDHIQPSFPIKRTNASAVLRFFLGMLIMRSFTLCTSALYTLASTVMSVANGRNKR